jgi:hypothetical protein
MDLSGGMWLYEFTGFTLRDRGFKVRGWPPWHWREMYEFTADPHNPLTFYVKDYLARGLPGPYIRRDRHGDTDMGSVPEPVQVIVSKDHHLPSYLVHDGACDDHGLWFASEMRGVYIFQRISSATAAMLLGMGFHAAGYPKRGQLVYQMVRCFGPQFEAGE